MNQTVSKKFTFIAHITVPAELDRLLVPIDDQFRRGTLHNKIMSSIALAWGGYSVREKHLAGKVIDRAGLWVDGLTLDHVNGKPEDNTLQNLELVTQKVNTLRRKTHDIQQYALVPSSVLGQRTYAFVFDVVVDQINSDLLDTLERKYLSGALQYRVLHGINNRGGGSSLAKSVLLCSGVSVPKGLSIDHINGDNGNHMPDNLRVVPMTINNRNKGHNRSALA